jgi:hypothetical protein
VDRARNQVSYLLAEGARNKIITYFTPFFGD